MPLLQTQRAGRSFPLTLLWWLLEWRELAMAFSFSMTQAQSGSEKESGWSFGFSPTGLSSLAMDQPSVLLTFGCGWARLTLYLRHHQRI
jgi:hypothetical protein